MCSTGVGSNVRPHRGQGQRFGAIGDKEAQSCALSSPADGSGLARETERLCVRIVIWSNDTKLAVRGVVVSRRPGFGISIKFTEMTEEVRQQLQRVIQSLIVRSG